MGEVEALLQVFGRRLPQAQLLRRLLVEEAHLLQWGGGVKGQWAGTEEGGLMVGGLGQGAGTENGVGANGNGGYGKWAGLEEEGLLR